MISLLALLGKGIVFLFNGVLLEGSSEFASSANSLALDLSSFSPEYGRREGTVHLFRNQ